MGIKALRKIQLGIESTSGTAVAATAVLRGTGALEDKRTIVNANEDVGIFGGSNRTYTPWLEGGLQLDIDATYEQLPYVLACGIKDVVSGAADTGEGATGKIYTYPFPTTTANSIKTATIETGDDVAAEEMEYSFVDNFKITGTPKEGLKVSSSWIGRQISTSAFTGELSIPAVNDILFSTGKLFIDPTSTYPATTAVSNSLLGFTLDVKTGWRYVASAGAAGAYFDFIKNTGAEINLDITFEHNASAAAEKAAWRAETARSLLLKFEGKALGKAGAYSKYTLVIQLAGKWLNFSQLGEQDGNDIVSGKFQAKYDGTASAIGQIIVVNETASL